MLTVPLELKKSHGPSTARSSLPSPLKSPVANFCGPVLIGWVAAWGWNVPLGWLSRICREPLLLIARSALPSQLKSPEIASASKDRLGSDELTGAANVPSPCPA